MKRLRYIMDTLSVLMALCEGNPLVTWRVIDYISRITHMDRTLVGFFLVIWHYTDVIMGAIASQITSLAIVYSAAFIQMQIKENIKAPRHWPLCGNRWISRTNGQYRGKCFHLMTSSWKWGYFRPTHIFKLNFTGTGETIGFTQEFVTQLITVTLLTAMRPGNSFKLISNNSMHGKWWCYGITI